MPPYAAYARPAYARFDASQADGEQHQARDPGQGPPDVSAAAEPGPEREAAGDLEEGGEHEERDGLHLRRLRDLSLAWAGVEARGGRWRHHAGSGAPPRSRPQGARPALAARHRLAVPRDARRVRGALPPLPARADDARAARGLPDDAGARADRGRDRRRGGARRARGRAAPRAAARRARPRARLRGAARGRRLGRGRDPGGARRATSASTGSRSTCCCSSRSSCRSSAPSRGCPSSRCSGAAGAPTSPTSS